jgi:selenocysteine-specific elongation factor
MRVIGTAGHVDHGKSTLVQALTGTHPDRLKEEREREMTIDLGFAWMTLPDGEEVGIVDVPGHRDFIENMLAGVGGIDAALFVIAADEGVMPQTREHLAILDLLQIQGGVVALTKIDMLPDPEWLDLVEDEVRQVMAGTVLGDAPQVRVSARTGAGLPELIRAITECLAERPSRLDQGRPRLPVDRVFSMPGFGTVVTGTLVDGSLRLGDEVVVLPRGERGRVRGLQSHKRKAEIAVPGSRTAVNVSGIALEDIQRGDVIAHPGDYRPTARLDVTMRLLADVSQPLKHNTEVKLFVGAKEVLARLRLLGEEELSPGEEGWLQLETSEPVVAARGDHYILRRPSPGETLGGGVVVDPHPGRRHKRFAEATLQRLRTLAQGEPVDLLLQALAALKVAPLKDVVARSNLRAEAVPNAIQQALQRGVMLLLEENASPKPGDDSLVGERAYWHDLNQRALEDIARYHRSFPLRRGMPREELKSRLKVTPRVSNALLRSLRDTAQVIEAGPLVLRAGHQLRFNDQQQAQVDRLLAQFSAQPYSPPSVKESLAQVGEDVFAALLELGMLVQVAPEVVFSQQAYQMMVAQIRKLLQQQGTVTAAQVRDHFNTSRKYTLALLEHLDAQGITVRDGDARRLKG